MSTPGQCNTCGEPILWTRQASNPDRWNRPLDMSSSVKAFVVINEQTLYVDTYQNHVCSNQAATIYVNQQRMENSDPIVAEPTIKIKKKQRAAIPGPAKPRYSSQELEHLAKEVACPYPNCTGAPGMGCIDTSELLDLESMNKNPFPRLWGHQMHAVRFEAAFKKNGVEEEDWRKTYGDLERNIEHDAKWQPHREKKVRDRVIARAKRTEFDKKVIRTTECSKCGASRGTECWDLKTVQVVKKKDRLHIRFPHRDRTQAYLAKQKDA